MTRHPTARRVHRQHSEGDDAFVANVLEGSVWAREHSRTLLIAGIAVVVLAVAAFLFISTRRNKEEKATTELTPLRALVQNGQVQEAVPQLETFVASYGGTETGVEARLMLAQQYLLTGQPKKAIDVVAPVGNDYDDPAAVNAANLQAAAYEADQQAHKAEEIYLKLGEGAPYLFQKQDALDNAARLRLERGDAAGAVQLYQKLLDGTPEDNAVRQIWSLRLAEAQAASATGKKGS